MYQSISALLILTFALPFFLMPIVCDGQYTGFKAYLQALGCVVLGELVLAALFALGLLFALAVGLK